MDSGDDRLFVRTPDRDSATIVITPSPVRDFKTSAFRLNQFPFEAALIRKDLLPQTLRAHWARVRPAGDTSMHHPPFFPPAFDLATEAAWCLKEHADAAAAGAPAAWALKPATAARSVGVGGTASAAAVAAFRAAGGIESPADFVAQRVVTRPWTVGGFKADLRVLLVVRSFSPPAASLYRSFHARLAAEPLPASLGDALVASSFSTVSCYDKDHEEEATGADHATAQEFLPRPAVDAALAASGADPAAVEASLADLCRQVVLAGSASIGGPWPGCAAVYGLDVMLAEKEGGGGGAAVKTPTARALVPQLLECNFNSDLTVAASFRPNLPGLLLEQMFGPEEEEKGKDGESLFLPLF